MLKVGQKVKVIVPKSDRIKMHPAHNKIGEIIQIANVSTNIFEQNNALLDVYVKVDKTVYPVNRNWLEVIK
jgi:hypothetical protein